MATLRPPLRRTLRPTLGLALAAALAGCASSGETAPAARPRPARSAAPVGPDAGGPQATPDAPLTPTSPPRRTAPEPTLVDLWHDTSAGPLSTLVYVTEQVGPDGKVGPAALVFSSDPSNAHFKRGSSQRVTVQRLVRSDMRTLMADLDAAGLGSLPWADEPMDASIGPARALYLYEAGRRRRVEKASIVEAARRSFTAAERRLIQEAGKTHDGPVSGSSGTGVHPIPEH